MELSIYGRSASVEVVRKPTTQQLVNFIKEADEKGATELTIMRGEAGHQLAKGLFGFPGWKLSLAPGGGHTLNHATTQKALDKFNYSLGLST
ncbi:coenzyme PQQ synthesis protein E [Novimethylophilus kurashikiensis]|uniref:Coenzyme PQQ synthesis protein E n=1 Tax=Novimethylophilus kurashikiensis TaxID=1825523 RepID=A0A2R5F926_9PROT|nr:hypothetical protein [Novimethylophilus kurashikiensis]GBG14535.1 coenzyme PQQ synthesis protein E [Novimethylophilus kurashikiensis]